MGIRETDPITQLGLPPGFRFYPTDEELLMQYLCRKVAGHQFALEIIGEIDLYKFDPWDLPSKATFGEKEWYFFSPRDKKYPNGSRPNRVAGCGYWKATGTDKMIFNEGRRVGIKKALVFYIGKAPKGTKTNWIMHEYRLIESTRKNGSMRLDDWVLCRIYKKGSNSSSNVNSNLDSKESSSTSTSSQYDNPLEYLHEIDNFNWASLVGPDNSEAQLVPQFNNNMNVRNDIYAPTMSHFSGKVAGEEVSGPRLDRPGFFRQNEFGSLFDPFCGSGFTG